MIRFGVTTEDQNECIVLAVVSVRLTHILAAFPDIRSARKACSLFQRARKVPIITDFTEPELKAAQPVRLRSGCLNVVNRSGEVGSLVVLSQPTVEVLVAISESIKEANQLIDVLSKALWLRVPVA